MNLKPASQLTLYGLNDDFNELASLYKILVYSKLFK